MFNSGFSTYRMVIRGVTILFGVGLFIAAFGLLYPVGQAQTTDPHWGQFPGAQPANLNFQSLSTCTSEFFLVGADGNKTSLADQTTSGISFTQLRVDGVQLEFESSGSCHVILNLKPQS